MNISLLDPMSLIVEDEEAFVEMPLKQAFELMGSSRDSVALQKPVPLVGQIVAEEVKIIKDMKNFSFDMFEEM